MKNRSEPVAALLAGMLEMACGGTEQGVPAVCDAGAAGMSASGCDADGDGHERPDCGGDDCDDTHGHVYPGREDTCDGDDNDCDGTVDQEGAPATALRTQNRRGCPSPIACA
jgi:hypothetical protein